MIDITRGFKFVPALAIFGTIAGITSYKNYECATTDFAYDDPITIREDYPEIRALECTTYTYSPPLHKNIGFCKAMYAVSFATEALFFGFLGQALTHIFTTSATAIIAPAIEHTAAAAIAIAPHVIGTVGDKEEIDCV